MRSTTGLSSRGSTRQIPLFVGLVVLANGANLAPNFWGKKGAGRPRRLLPPKPGVCWVAAGQDRAPQQKMALCEICVRVGKSSAGNRTAFGPRPAPTMAATRTLSFTTLKRCTTKRDKRPLLRNGPHPSVSEHRRHKRARADTHPRQEPETACGAFHARNREAGASD